MSSVEWNVAHVGSAAAAAGTEGIERARRALASRAKLSRSLAGPALRRTLDLAEASVAETRAANALLDERFDDIEPALRALQSTASELSQSATPEVAERGRALRTTSAEIASRAAVVRAASANGIVVQCVVHDELESARCRALVSGEVHAPGDDLGHGITLVRTTERGIVIQIAEVAAERLVLPR